MGYLHVEFKIVASVSRHNSDKDKEHDELWEDVIRRVDEIMKDPKYSEIQVMSF
jgi:hypothetical protein